MGCGLRDWVLRSGFSRTGSECRQCDARCARGRSLSPIHSRGVAPRRSRWLRGPVVDPDGDQDGRIYGQWGAGSQAVLRAPLLPCAPMCSGGGLPGIVSVSCVSRLGPVSLNTRERRLHTRASERERVYARAGANPHTLRVFSRKCFSRRSPLPWLSRHLRLVDPPCGTTVPWSACRPPRSRWLTCRSLDTLRMKIGSSGWTCQPSARRCARSAGAFATRRVRQTWNTFARSAVGRARAAPSASRRWACL